MVLFFFPLLWLPSRVFAAYCYVPFGGLAIAMAGMAEEVKPAVLAAFFLLWTPLDIQRINLRGAETLQADRDAREWISTVERFAKRSPATAGFVFQDRPAAFRIFGLEGALKYFYNTTEITLRSQGSPEAAELLRAGNTALLRWDGQRHRLEIQTR
jgi:hypothetical protein